MTELTPEQLDAMASVRSRLGTLPPKSASAAYIDYAVLNSYGFEELATRLWTEASEMSTRASAEARRRIRAEFGAISPRGGAITILIPLLTFASIASGITARTMLGGLSLGALLCAAFGLTALILAAATRVRPVTATTSYQSQVCTALLAAAATFGFLSVADAASRALFVTGPIAALLATLLYGYGRARDREGARHIDGATERIRAEANAGLEEARLRMWQTMAEELADRPEIDSMRQVRSLAIAAFRAEGSTAVDADPGALPGTYIIAENVRA